MTSQFQTDLRARAAAHAREWQDGADPSVGLAEVEGTVRRRRRTRGVLAGVGSVAGLALVMGVAYVGLGRGPDAGPAEVPPVVASGLSALSEVDAGSVVVTVRESVAEAGLYMGLERVLIVDKETESVEEIPGRAVLDELGVAVEDWPSVSLVAVDPAQSLAVFLLWNPASSALATVAVHDWSTGATVVTDPCTSTLQRINLSEWCPIEDEPVATVDDPATGESVEVQGFNSCEGARERYGDLLVAACIKTEVDVYLVTVDPQSGEVVSAQSVGRGGGSAPWVVGGQVFYNAFTTEGGQLLVGGSGAAISVGGGAVGGVAVVGDRLLIHTSSDVWGAESSYGHVLGLLEPSTGAFTELEGITLERGAQVGSVEVLG